MIFIFQLIFHVNNDKTEARSKVLAEEKNFDEKSALTFVVPERLLCMVVPDFLLVWEMFMLKIDMMVSGVF